MASFTEQLAAAKRKAQLSGRPISQQEVTGIAAAASETASARLVRAKALTLQEEEGKRTERLQTERLAEEAKRQEEALAAEAKLQAEKLAQEKAIEEARLAEQQKEYEQSLAQQKYETEQQIIASKEAAKSAEKQAQIQTTVAGTAIGGYLAAGTATGGPVGAVIGAAVGYVASSSYLCTAANDAIGLTEDDRQALKRFRQYVMANHREILKFYLEIGPKLTAAIATKEDNREGQHEAAIMPLGFYKNLKEKMIQPVIIASESSHQEQAFWIYRRWVVRLIKKYTPHLLKRAIEVVKLDHQKFKEAA